jgi:superfamily II DNA or RNA helicase
MALDSASRRLEARAVNDYREFVANKLQFIPPSGMSDVPALHRSLYPHQRDLVAWALRRGRAALFADTGLGKTAMQLEWARHLPVQRTIILAPLAVAAQTVREGARMGIAARECRDGAEVQDGITITNYERLHRFDPRQFDAVVLDESSIIKHHDAKTLRLLLDAFAQTPWKLCATATPAPNDYTELGTHAEFLGICTRAEMLSEFFTHDGGETQTWRLKKHARSEYWRWVASWAALVQKPSDLGYDDAGYALPPFTVRQHTIAADQDAVLASGQLFAFEAQTLMERRQARKGSVGARVAAVAERVTADTQPWIVWCDLNAESEALVAAIPGAVEVRGSQSIDEKEKRLSAFASGETRVLVTKPSIAGFGLNWQHCARVAFVGVTDSWEAYYQAVRRCWRYGQTQNVEVHIFSSEMEGAVVSNLLRKEKDAAAMSAELSAMTAECVRENVTGSTRASNPYQPEKHQEIPSWLKSSTNPSPIATPSTTAIA